MTPAQLLSQSSSVINTTPANHLLNLIEGKGGDIFIGTTLTGNVDYSLTGDIADRSLTGDVDDNLSGSFNDDTLSGDIDDSNSGNIN